VGAKLGILVGDRRYSWRFGAWCKHLLDN
jgi:hypothetical protein